MVAAHPTHTRPWLRSALEIGCLLLLALVLRVGYIEQSGFTPDLEAIEVFGRATQDGGLLSVYARTPLQDYPPVPLVVMWAGFTAQAEFSQLSTMAVLKVLAIAGDLALIGLAYVVFRGRGWGLRLGIPLAVVLMPGVVATSAFWGQFDSAWVVCVVFSAYMLKRSRLGLAWSVFALGLLIKPQVIVLAPVLGMMTLLTRGWRGVLRGGVAMSLTFAVVLLPFIVASGFQETLRPFTSSVGRYPILTLNALNVWIVYTARLGLPLEAPSYSMLYDNLPVFGFFNAHQLGLLLLGLYLLLLVMVMVQQRKQERIFTWAGAMFFAFFMLPTQMHERYIFPAAVLALFAIAEDRRMIWIAVPLAVTFSYNILAITTTPFVWLGVNLWYYAGEAGLYVALLNTVILVVWTWFLLTPAPLARPRVRRADAMFRGGLAAALLGLVVFMALPEPLPPMTALDTKFDNGARLLGYTLTRGPESIDVTLFWGNSGSIPEDLIAVVYGLSNGEPVAEDEQIPTVPPRRWALGEFVSTHHVLDTRGLDVDAVTLAAGLVTHYNMERVSAVQDGVPAPESLIRLDSPAAAPPPA